jgi:flagellar biosynthesis component FlhA
LDEAKSAYRVLNLENLESALENLLDAGISAKKIGTIEGILNDKAKTQKAAAKALLEDIRARQTVNKCLLDKLDYEICAQDTQIMGIESRKERYVFDNFIQTEKLKLKLEDRVLELKKEKRKEYLEYWRDMMFMKKYLLSSLKDYWDIARKRNVLSMDVGAFTDDEISKRYQGAL